MENEDNVYMNDVKKKGRGDGKEIKPLPKKETIKKDNSKDTYKKG